jgi:hypothetical protein
MNDFYGLFTAVNFVEIVQETISLDAIAKTVARVIQTLQEEQA